MRQAEANRKMSKTLELHPEDFPMADKCVKLLNSTKNLGLWHDNSKSPPRTAVTKKTCITEGPGGQGRARALLLCPCEYKLVQQWLLIPRLSDFFLLLYPCLYSLTKIRKQ